ncbi:MAG: hypothetical protein ABI818_16665 [Acidobacteriota bacterium]
MSGAGRTGRLPRALRIAVAAALASALFPHLARAQMYVGSTAPHAGSVEVSAGASWAAAYELNARNAEETRNTGSGSDPFVLFATKSRVTAGTGGQVRVGLYLTHSLMVEGGVHYLRPSLDTRVTSDVEAEGTVTATERLTRYVVDGSLVAHLTPLSFAGGHGVPFVLGGAGYLREVHARSELIETGREFHGGAGLKVWLGGGAPRFGVRVDVGVSSRHGGVDFDTARRTVRTAGASLMVLF